MKNIVHNNLSVENIGCLETVIAFQVPTQVLVIYTKYLFIDYIFQFIASNGNN